jgi:hypothetical protein
MVRRRQYDAARFDEDANRSVVDTVRAWIDAGK